MADLTDLTAAQTVKVAGANTTGVELNYVSAQTSGTQVALDVGINVAGVQIDPRNIGVVQTSAPTPEANNSITTITTDDYARPIVAFAEASNAQWGQMFSVSTNSQALTGTTEVAFFYFQNPNGSGKTAKIFRLSFGPTLGNNYVTYRVYLDATVTSNGTGLVEVGNRQTSQSSNVTNAFLTPTVSANGTELIATYVTSGLSGLGRDIQYNFSLWIEPNHNIVITRQLSANATIGGINMEWAEQ